MMDREAALSVLQDWRNRWEIAAQEVYDEADQLTEVTVGDLESQIADVKYAAESCRDAVPCEDGLQEFVDNFAPGDDHEDCVPQDEVILSELQASNDRIVQEQGLVRKGQVLAILLAMETEMNFLRAVATEIRMELTRNEFGIEPKTVADRIQRIRSG